MPQDGPWMGTGMLAVLELLSSEAPVDRLDALVEDARRRGATAAELEDVEHARRLALTIHARLARRHQREVGLSALVDAALDLAAPNDLEAMLKVITRRARLLLGVDMAYVSLPDEDEEGFSVRASDGHTSMLNVGLRLRGGAGVGSVVLSRPAPFWTPDYLSDDRFQHSEIIDEVVRVEGLHAIMAVPLLHGTRAFGALYVADRRIRHFTADEISLMNSFGNLAGVALEKSRHLDHVTAEASGLRERVTLAEANLDVQRELYATQDLLIELVLKGGDMRALVEETNQRLGGRPLVMCGADGTVLARAGATPRWKENDLIVAAMDAHAVGQPVPVRLDSGIWAAPVFADNEYLGALLLDLAHTLTDREQQTFGTAARIAGVLLLQRGAATVPEHFRDQLLCALLSGPRRPPPDIERRARRLGVDLSEPHVLVVVRPEEHIQAKTVTWASSYAHRKVGLYSAREGCAVLLLPGEDAGEAARVVAEELTRLLGHAATVGAAGPVTDPGSVLSGYQEAVRCLDAMTALGATGSAASARELGFLGVLLSDNLDAEGFIDSVIGPVLGYDKQRFTELARTLEAYFDSGGSPTHAAEKLHVHPNTVARRLERISELLGPEWQKPDRALEVQLALRLSRIRGVLRERRFPSDGNTIDY